LASLTYENRTEGISVEEGTQAYARLKARVREAGILDRSLSYYIPLIAFVFLGLALSAWAIYTLESYPLLALACLGFTFFSVQIAGVMHDSGHRAVFSSIRLNQVLGISCSILLGMVFDNWRTRHNIHHAFPNEESKDPDVEVPFLATSESLYSNKSPLQRFFARYQAYYYYPLGSIVSFSNRLGTISYFKGRSSWKDFGRLAAYLPAAAFLFVLPFVLFSPPKALFVFALVHITSGIYLANCFAPNHKGMTMLKSSEGMSFIEQQVITSRNVKGGFLTDVVLVGLNHQIEHHLFPSTPRNKLHLLRPYVKETCDELGLPFVESGIIETNRDIIRQLRAVTRQVKARPSFDSPS
jgi:fatty acid desaturase